jgi:hypothetical protein
MAFSDPPFRLKCNFPLESESYANTRKDPCNKGVQTPHQGDRDRIQALLDAKEKPVEIARILGRDKTTIGREIRRNKRVRGDIPVVNPEQYDYVRLGYWPCSLVDRFYPML